MESNGYATVAKSIAQDPDKETYVFRRFDKLTARNLLNLQGELLVLQNELGALDAKAASSRDPDLLLSMRSWCALMSNAKDPSTGNGEEATKRLKIASELEVKLRKYRKFTEEKETEIVLHKSPRGEKHVYSLTQETKLTTTTSLMNRQSLDSLEGSFEAGIS